jgi:putative ABC transport system substrate-binding protein
VSGLRRRRFVAALVSTALWPLGLRAQERIRVIGYLTPAAKPALRDEIFLKGLRELGWIEGKNIRIEYRRAANSTERLAAMAEELVRLKVDVLVAQSTPAVEAAKNATQTIPIVSMSADPVGNKFVASLARPGGNITGLSMMMPQLAGKRLELLKEIIPGLSRVAFLLYAKDRSHRIFAKEAEDAARALGIQLQPVIVNGLGELDAAFASMRKEKADALIAQPLFINTLGATARLVELAMKNRLPMISDGDGIAEAGGLLFFGPDPMVFYERIVVSVDRVLKGGKPAEMPIEQPSKFLLVINLKTAKTLGLKIPPPVLARADRVIE